MGSEQLDDDGDDLSNLLEFALGSDPLTPNEATTLTRTGSLGVVTFTKHLARSGVILEFQTSKNLQNWSTQSTSETSQSASISTQEFLLNFPEDQKLFWRVRAISSN